MARTRSRASREGTLYFDKADQRWRGWVDMGRGENGRRDRRHVASRSQAEVIRRMRELAAKRDSGVVPAKGRQPTLAEWLRYYADSIAARKVRPSTLQSYRWLIESHLIPKLGHHRLDRL
jgi:integrase